MRKTKIVCTIGPASDAREVIVGLCKAGMNVARLNFSHNTHADHQKRIDLIKEVREELKLPIAIMLDTKGPEYRIKTFKNKKITLVDIRYMHPNMLEQFIEFNNTFNFSILGNPSMPMIVLNSSISCFLNSSNFSIPPIFIYCFQKSNVKSPSA